MNQNPKQLPRTPAALADAIVADYLKGFSQTKVADARGVSPALVSKLLKRTGLVGRSCRLLPDDIEVDMAADFVAGHTYVFISAKYGVTVGLIEKALRRQGVPKRWSRVARPPGASGKPPRRFHSLDEGAFDDVEANPEAAYWVGFLMADGCVSRPRKGQAKLALGLAIRDVDHVRKFRRFLSSSNKITFGPARVIKHREKDVQYVGLPSARIAVTSARLAFQVGRWGVVPNKTHRTQVIGLEQNMDFWRGLIDGDGSLGIYRINRKPRPVITGTGSRTIMEQYARFVRSYVPTRAHVTAFGPIWGFAVSGPDAVEFARLLYADGCTSLARKQAMACQIMAMTL